MKNFSGVCQAAGADKPLRAFFIWITNIVTLTDYLTASLYAFGGIPTVRLKKRQNWEEVAKPR